MEWFRELVFGTGIAHSILLLALVIAVGAALAKIKVAGVSLGMTWILFVGIVASHFGLVLDPVVLGFIRDFGLIVFIFAVGMQVGPSFFSSFRKGGLKLNGFAVLSIALSVGIALIICKVADVKLTTMTGILSGDETNNPGIGAALCSVQRRRSILMRPVSATPPLPWGMRWPIRWALSASSFR